jgi:tRNA dimethylallyltransferase
LPEKLNLIVIAGPTGSGKSDLALRLAGRFGGEVVNCDSVQIFRLFNIGTAKLAEKERRGIPHHLIDIAEPDELFTAGDFARVGRPVLREIAERGRLPVITGGTGFYLRALIEGPGRGGMKICVRVLECVKPGVPAAPTGYCDDWIRSLPRAFIPTISRK